MEHKEELGTPQLRAVLKITKETGERLDQDTIVQLLADSRNWIPAFFKEVQPFHGNTELSYKIFKAGIDLTDYYPLYEAWEECQNTMQAAVNRLLEEPEPMPAPAEHSTRVEKPPTVVCDGGPARPLKEFKPIKAITAAELDELDIQPIDWLVKDILPVGLAILGAPSKYYKSYMALGLCIAICQGGKFLHFDCEKHACLYFDLESTKRRPKNRLDQILGSDQKKPNNLHIITGEDNPGRIGEGFEAQVEYQLSEHPDIKLIVVDVFQLIRQPAKRGQSGYDRDYEDFRALKQIVDKHDVGILLIHHTRKMKDPTDVFNELSGSTGMLGAQDCAWVISKKNRTDNEATLHITGRDLDSQALKIEFIKKIFQWQYIGTEEEVEDQRRVTEYLQSPIRETIVKLVYQGSGQWEGKAEDIKGASKYLSQEIYDDVRKIGKFFREYVYLFQGIYGVNAVPGNTKTRKWRFNDINAINDTNATQIELEYQG